jgi:hypothetical protein
VVGRGNMAFDVHHIITTRGVHMVLSVNDSDPFWARDQGIVNDAFLCDTSQSSSRIRQICNSLMLTVGGLSKCLVEVKGNLLLLLEDGVARGQGDSLYSPE